jgi:DNA-binding transcriptional regulator YiaG
MSAKKSRVIGDSAMSKIDALLDRKSEPRNDLPKATERKRLREAWGLSQEQVAEALGVTRGSVSAWEAGRWEPAGENRTEYAYLLTSIANRLNESANQEGTSDEQH